MTILLSLAAFIFAVLFLVDLLIGFKMTKSIINRFTSKAENLAEEFRDPVADAKGAIRKIENDKEDAVALRKTLLVKLSTLKSRIAKAKANVDKFESLAVLAGRAGNAEDVQSALQSKNNEASLVSDLESQLLATQKQEDELEALIKNCDSLIENAKNKTEIVASQIETNKFKAQVASVLKDNSGDAVSALQRLEADAERYKAEAEAAEEFAGENQSLEQKYAVKPTVSEADVSKYLKTA